MLLHHNIYTEHMIKPIRPFPNCLCSLLNTAVSLPNVEHLNQIYVLVECHQLLKSYVEGSNKTKFDFVFALCIK